MNLYTFRHPLFHPPFCPMDGKEMNYLYHMNKDKTFHPAGPGTQKYSWCKECKSLWLENNIYYSLNKQNKKDFESSGIKIIFNKDPFKEWNQKRTQDNSSSAYSASKQKENDKK